MALIRSMRLLQFFDIHIAPVVGQRRLIKRPVHVPIRASESMRALGVGLADIRPTIRAK